MINYMSRVTTGKIYITIILPLEGLSLFYSLSFLLICQWLNRSKRLSSVTIGSDGCFQQDTDFINDRNKEI